MTIQELLTTAVSENAADVFIIAGRPLSLKTGGMMKQIGERILPDSSRELISQIYQLAGNRSMDTLLRHGDDDFSFAINGLARFRVNTYRQRSSLAAVIRIIRFSLPRADALNIPSSIIDLSSLPNGLVLVTGPAGSGKSTTQACMIDHINRTMQKHIITLEDPIEYLHSHQSSIVSQREISTDTDSYVTALRASLRQSPDVILVGEMRDYETMQIAMTAAETGHLIISTLHTTGAANSIDRIIDVFPPDQQHQIKIQLSMVLQAVISQQLVPAKDGGHIPAFEIMTMTPAYRNMIREGKVFQIDSTLYSQAQNDMISMDSYLIRLFRQGKITRDTAIQYASKPEMIQRKLL